MWNTHGSYHVWELKGTVFKLSFSEPQNYSNYQGQFHQGSWARQVSTEQRETGPLLEMPLLFNGCKGTFFHLGLRMRGDSFLRMKRQAAAGGLSQLGVSSRGWWCGLWRQGPSLCGRSRKGFSLSNRGQEGEGCSRLWSAYCVPGTVRHFFEILIQLPETLPVRWVRKLKHSRQPLIFLWLEFFQ